MKIVGVNHSGYNTTRNISSLPFKNYKVEKKNDLFKFPEHFYYRLKGKTHPVLFNLHNDLGLVKCDLWHFFNTVSFSKKPWFTTFETLTPRFHGKYQETGVKLIAGKHCKKLIAMSEMAKNSQLDFLKNKYPKYLDKIVEKITIVHPSQQPLINVYEDKRLDSTISFIITGTEFFRKGGNEIISVFDKLLTEGKDLKLYIISGMQYVNTHGTEEDYKNALQVIAKHKDRIIHYPHLPNKEVLKLLLQCHVALLPSYSETYGYSVLEAQAAGCPVVTTDVLALKEINNKNTGWLIELPEIVRDKAGREIYSSLITAGLEKYILTILENSAIIRTKGVAALERIKTQHDPYKTAAQIEEMYNLALEY